MKVELSYGQKPMPVEFPDDRTVVIRPAHTEGLPDEKAALFTALRNPVGCRPLAAWIKPGAHLSIVFTDITRPTPNQRLVPWLLEYLAPLVPESNVTLINSLGTHRSNTRQELEHMLTPDVVARYRIVDNEPHNAGAHVQVGVTRRGVPALLCRAFVQADVRIVTGFIEPHFFAGFSGGPKGIMPGVAALSTVMSNHDARHIADPNSTFGVTEGNPIWEEMRDIALMAGPSFLVNVTLNHQRRITGVFAGDLIAAHKQGIEFVRRAAMQPVAEAFEVVVTTNSGYPLDLNLYQGVKGMSAAARIVKPGGLIILACECRDGVPAGSPYESLLRSGKSPEAILQGLLQASHTAAEQWQAQIQTLIQRKATVKIFSTLPDETVRSCYLEPCRDIRQEVLHGLDHAGPQARVAVLPDGPLTIPYLAK